jgi:hypothetical protein
MRLDTTRRTFSTGGFPDPCAPSCCTRQNQNQPHISREREREEIPTRTAAGERSVRSALVYLLHASDRTGEVGSSRHGRRRRQMGEADNGGRRELADEVGKGSVGFLSF